MTWLYAVQVVRTTFYIWHADFYSFILCVCLETINFKVSQIYDKSHLNVGSIFCNDKICYHLQKTFFSDRN